MNVDNPETPRALMECAAPLLAKPSLTEAEMRRLTLIAEALRERAARSENGTKA